MSYNLLPSFKKKFQGEKKNEEVPKKQFGPFWPYRALGGTIVNVRGNSQKPEVFMG